MSDIKVHFLTDLGSWIEPHIDRITKQMRLAGYENVRTVNCLEQLTPGEILFILSYSSILSEEYLNLHNHNLVIHESDLPRGRGFSPMSWQILEDRREIPFCLFEAVTDVDSGPVYDRRILHLKGTELHHEWRELQGLLTERMVLDFVDQYPDVRANPQKGKPSYYRARTHADDEIDMHQSFESVFHKVRVCDPENYPAWFKYMGRKYKLLIEYWE